MKTIGNYNCSGSIEADFLIVTWGFKSVARKIEWEYAGHSLEQFDAAKNALIEKGLIRKNGALTPTTKRILASAEYGQSRVEAALGLV